MIRVVIAEDQAMVLGALAALLETEPGIEVVGRATTGDAALSLVRELAPDVLVTDIEMPGSSGLDAAAIRRVHAGGRVIDPELAADAWTEADPLTDRERQVLRLAAEGLTSSDIGATLQLSEGTVRNYLSEAISKLGAKNRVEAANMARVKGWP
jgi:two-component system response regulator DesR